MSFEVESVSNLQWGINKEYITMDVKFAEFDSVLPFAANPLDPVQHGRELFERAVNGEFGVVAEYIPPTAHDLAVIESPQKRDAALELSIKKILHYDIVQDIPRATEWRDYYRDMYMLDQSPDWPDIKIWPKAPY